MGLKGQFNWIQSMRQGGRKAISFVLTCDNFFQSETFDASIVDGASQLQPMIFRQQELKAKKSLRFDFDTVGWNWCQGDTFALLDKNGRMGKHWTLNIRVAGPGECKDCHGTHKCRHCNGTGIITDRRTHTVTQCEVCKGTGVCQTCYVPMRNPQLYNNSFNTNGWGNNGGMDFGAQARERKINALRQRISELQSKIERAEWGERMMQLRGTDISSRNVYISQANLKGRVNQQVQHYMKCL